jgi:hypothetical protein
MSFVTTAIRYGRAKAAFGMMLAGEICLSAATTKHNEASLKWILAVFALVAMIVLYLWIWRTHGWFVD